MPKLDRARRSEDEKQEKSISVRRWNDFNADEQADISLRIQVYFQRKRRNQRKRISVVYVGPHVRSQKRKKPEKASSGDELHPYRERARVLRELEFASYQAYLDNDLWKGIRAKVLKRARYKCQVCRKRATEVHHGSYHREDLDGTTLKNLFPICRGCHERIEYRKKGHRKLTPLEATAKMKSLRKQLSPGLSI